MIEAQKRCTARTILRGQCSVKGGNDQRDEDILDSHGLLVWNISPGGGVGIETGSRRETLSVETECATGAKATKQVESNQPASMQGRHPQQKNKGTVLS